MREEDEQTISLLSLFYLANDVLGYTLAEGTHRKVCEFLETWNRRKKLLLLPRGTFKTTLATVAYSIQRVLQNPNIRILIASETLNQAIKFLSEIKGHFESDRFKQRYGNLQKETGWKESEITVASRTQNRKEPTIMTAGIDVTRTGFHFDLIIVDDCHSQKNTTNREQIEQTLNWYRLLLSMLEPEGKILVVGTRWDFDDLYGHIIKNLWNEYDIMVEKAIRPDGSLFFPERLTAAFLDEQKKEQGSYVFSMQYQQEPIPSEFQTFREEDFRFYDGVNKDDLVRFITVDPSLSTEEQTRGDKTAIAVVGVDNLNRWYILDLINSRLSPEQINQELLRLCSTWKPEVIGIESVVFSALLKPAFEKYAIESYNIIPEVIELKTYGKQKETRIKSLQPFFERHEVFMKKPNNLERDIWYDLQEQLLRFPKTQYDDIIDALAYIPQLIYYRQFKEKTQSNIPPNPYPNDKDAPWNRQKQGTGYSNFYSY